MLTDPKVENVNLLAVDHFLADLEPGLVFCRGGSTLGPGGTGPPDVGQAPPNILVPTAKIRILKI